MPRLSNEVRFESLLVSLSRTQQRDMPWMGFELATIRLLFCAKKQLNFTAADENRNNCLEYVRKTLTERNYKKNYFCSG